MRVIHKFSIPKHRVFALEVPKSSRIIAINQQLNVPQLWLDVDPEEKENVIFELATIITGEQYQDEDWQYVGTYFLDDGLFVGHVLVRKGT